MSKVVQRGVQLLFLALFLTLMVLGRIQVWMGIFVVSAIASLLFSRFYCGWMCPINTLLKPVTWAKKKQHIKSFKVPKSLSSKWSRAFMLLLFLGVLVFTFRTGKKLPVLPVLVGLGFVLTLFFPEELWHHYLCPYGAIISLPSRKAKHAMKIDEEACINCGKCAKVCPSLAIVKEEKHHSIIKNECLVCRECVDACPNGAIAYT
ncbi:4Fe-4S binding protein [Sphaerochaeta sp. PS]|uniref:4Fe-4S binding protein n=1 Tax=Sphaerochaeta sp. PS TaxID=3076336 RepID=UPI0028A30DFD|nr:4Fe-4S binding protein [Sphaerochaeta sp. PS]MDT4763164.1 4Fe-4S binding protein [Sphaerochaeta sp. PS]